LGSVPASPFLLIAGVGHVLFLALVQPSGMRRRFAATPHGIPLPGRSAMAEIGWRLP